MAKLKRLGKYRLIRKIARGGMGTVYEALQEDLDRPVALKVLPKEFAKDPGFVKRFHREAQAAARLNHPNIVTVYEIGEDHGFQFFSMELVRGVSLAQRLHDAGPLDAREAVDLMIQAVGGLGHAWERKIIHRDLKPANLLLLPDGMLKIADFGLAKCLESLAEITQSGDRMGTPYYASPEQGASAKNVDHRTDVYSLGATLYHLLTGRLPFDATSPVEVAIKISTAPLAPLRDIDDTIPKSLAAIVERMMARDPDQRHQGSAALLTALHQCGVTPKRVRQTASQNSPPRELTEAKRLVRQGLRLKDSSQKAEAFACFDQATKLDSGLAEAWLFRGLHLHHVQPTYIEEMLDNLRRAVAIDSKYAAIYKSMLGMEDTVRQRVSSTLKTRKKAGHSERPSPDSGSDERGTGREQ